LKRIFIGMVLIVCLGLFWQSSNRVHWSLNIDQVSEIYLWTEDEKFGRIQKMATDDEKRQIVNWFNSVSNILENKEFAGETSKSGITISLKSSQTVIQVLRSGSEFEIQRVDAKNPHKRISYWARQQEIKNLWELLIPVPDEQQMNLVTKFIMAEYSGDIDTLLSITKDEANVAVRNGELNIFKSHKLDRIVSTTIVPIESPKSIKLIVAVNSQGPGRKVPTVYYEHLQIRKFNDKWFIIKIERDA